MKRSIAETLPPKEKYDEGPLQEFGQIQNKRSPRRVYFNEEKNYRKKARDGIDCSTCMSEDYNAYVYDNKILSSGYFPEYILYPCVDIDGVNSDCITDNIDLNLDYYPIFFEGKYTKQLSNKYSRYNNQYFGKQYSIYKICKKFWKPQEASPSCRIVANSSRIGTNGDSINKNQSDKHSNGNNSSSSNIKCSNNNKDKKRIIVIIVNLLMILIIALKIIIKIVEN